MRVAVGHRDDVDGSVLDLAAGPGQQALGAGRESLSFWLLLTVSVPVNFFHKRATYEVPKVPKGGVVGLLALLALRFLRIWRKISFTYFRVQLDNLCRSATCVGSDKPGPSALLQLLHGQ